MEDTFQALKDKYGDSNIGYYGVFDGHGGYRASAFAANMLHKYLKDAVTDSVKDTKNRAQMESAISKTFIKTDNEFLDKAKHFRWMDGTTAVAALVVRDGIKSSPPGSTEGNEGSSRKTGAVLYVANTGDSRAVLVRNGKAVPMSI